MHPVKAGPELGLRPTFRTVPAALCWLSGFACVRCLTYLSKDVCLRERQRYRRAVPAIHLRRWHREDGLPSIERSQSAHLAHSRAPRRRSPFRSHSRRSAGADPAGQFRPADCLRHPGLSARDGRKRRVPCGRLRAQVAFGLRTRHCKTSASCIGICDSEDESYFGLQG